MRNGTDRSERDSTRAGRPARPTAIARAIGQAAIVAVTDTRGVLTYVNDRYCEISRYSRDELTGRDCRIVNSGHHPAAFMGELWRTIAAGRMWHGAICNRAGDGSRFWVDTVIVPLFDSRGALCQYLALHADIEPRAAISGGPAQEPAAALGELAAIVAHEVRNPLAGLKGSLQVLQSRLDGSGQEHTVLGAMLARLDALNNRVNDILLWAGPHPRRRDTVALMPVLADAADRTRAVLRTPRIEIRSADRTIQVVGERDLLCDVFLNLLLNAAQASRAEAPAPIRVTAVRRGAVAIVRVDDRGTGIPAAIRDRIFDPFVTTRPGGTGLGLPIVRRLLEHQGGAVTLADRRGGGTTATVTLPAAQSGIALG